MRTLVAVGSLLIGIIICATAENEIANMEEVEVVLLSNIIPLVIDALWKLQENNEWKQLTIHKSVTLYICTKF